ncbi:MAG: SIR2 family protein [Halobacteriota archaeon]
MEEKETAKLENNKIIFFLGAGASVTARVPDTESFIYGNDGFKKRIEDKGSEEEKSVLQEILNILEKKNKETSQKYREFPRQNKDKKKSEEFERIKKVKEKFEKIDVELVLETLYKLNNKEVELLPDFYDENTLKFGSILIYKEKEKSLKSLEKKLRRFIREKTIVSEDKIDYLEPLKEFIGKYKTLDIFSVNYDTCIEQFCKEYGLRYTDGFELYWYPKLFDDSDYDVKLYKIHGSVMWYLTDRGTYVKIPIASKEKDEIEFITGETAKTLMVYPMGGKWEYAEPLLELIRRLHVGLEKAGVCIVIGYSFRDDYIRRIFFEAARTNKDLILFLIAPDAGKIYDDKLKFIDKDKRKPSPLEGRVICWNYPMDIVLKDYYLYRSLGKLSGILKGLEDAHEFKLELGSKVGAFEHRMQEVVSKCIDIGYTSMAEKVLEKELGMTNLKEESPFARKDRLKLHYSLGVYHLLSSDYKDAKRYFEELRKYFEHALEVGNKYFELHRQFSQSKEDKEKHKKIKREITEIESRERNSYYRWITKEDWGTSDCIEFLSQQKELRSKKDGIDAILSEITEICDDMKKCFDIPLDTDKYKDCEQISCGASVEIDRKTDLERNMNELLKVFDKLIDFCEQQEVEQIRD